MGIYSGLARHFYQYVSDDTNSYQIGTDADNGTANAATAVVPGANPTYPRGWVTRHVYGVASDGTRTKLPIFQPANALFVTGGTFSKGGVSFTVEGKIGEKRTNKGG